MNNEPGILEFSIHSLFYIPCSIYDTITIIYLHIILSDDGKAGRIMNNEPGILKFSIHSLFYIPCSLFDTITIK